MCLRIWVVSQTGSRHDLRERGMCEMFTEGRHETEKSIPEHPGMKSRYDRTYVRIKTHIFTHRVVRGQ